VFSAEFPDLLQIPGIRNDDSSFTLNRLKKYGCNIFIGLKQFFHGWDVIEWDQWEPRCERTELVVSRWIITSPGSSDSASPEIALHAYDLCLIIRDAFFHVAPSASKFDCGLTGFSP